MVYDIPMNSPAMICTVDSLLFGHPGNWEKIHTTHPFNIFHDDDEYWPNLASWFIESLANEIGESDPEKIKFFNKKDWIICCKV